MKPISVNKIPRDAVATWIDRETEGRDGETWRVWLLNNNKTHAYIKIPNNPITIISELAAAQVGRALSLNIPAPFLIQLDPDDIPEESAFYHRKPRLAYGCSACGKSTKSFERIMAHDQAVLDSWAELENTAIFDEWIANTDRNLGNLIYDTATRTYWLIDHGRAFTDLSSLFAHDQLADPAISVNNDLIKSIGKVDLAYATKLQTLSNQLMIKCKMVDLKSLDSDNHFGSISTQVSKEQLSQFLISRIHYTTELICNKTGHKMMDLRS